MKWMVLPVVVLVLLHAGWTVVEWWRFDTRLDSLRASGAPVELGDLVPPPVPDAHNAAPLMEEADRWYWKNLFRDKPVELLRIPQDRWDDNERATVVAWLDRSDPYIDLLARATARPVLREELEWKLWMGVPSRAAIYNAATLIRFRLDLTEPAMSAALREVAILLDLAVKTERHDLGSLFVRWHCNRVAAEALAALGRRQGSNAIEARALLDRRLMAGDQRTLLLDGLNAYRLMVLDDCRCWIAGCVPWGGMLPEDTSLPGPLLGSWLFRPLAYRDARRLLEVAERSVELARNGSPSSAWRGAEALEREFARRGLPYVYAGLFARDAAAAIRESLRDDARMRVTRVGLAVLALRQEHGAWPESLDAVRPLVGEETLLDPFTGRRFRYKPGEILETAAPIEDEGLRGEHKIVWRLR